MASLTIKNLVKRYNKTTVINKLNLHADDKEFIVLVGPSGCGKTTTLNAIAGLLPIDEGEIWFGDELVTAPQRRVFKIPQQRGVAMVFQDYAIYPHMTVFKNIAFPLEIQKLNRRDIEAKVKRAAQLLEIDNLLDRKPHALSGGQRQRIALARAMVRDPKIFLLDEPLANLDAKLRVRARVELRKLQRELGVTTIFVTHDQIEAMTMGDRIAVMNQGTLEQMGTPSELYYKPTNMFVARFIGSPPMNMLNGTLNVHGDKAIIQFDSFDFALPHSIVEKLTTTLPSKVTLGVRPEKTLISHRAQANFFPARVLHIELVGKEFNIYLESDDYSLISIQSAVQGLNVGDEVWLSFSENGIHIFDYTTGDLLACSSQEKI